MSREQRLQKLLKNSHVWKPGSAPAAARKTLPTGFSALDQRIGGGWPIGSLTEVLFSEPGIGELSLLLPGLTHLSDRKGLQDTHGYPGWLAWIAPPYIPYAPALSMRGVDLARLLLIHSHKSPDTQWAMEQALRSATCAAALVWFETIDDRAMRRLQLAAETGLCWAVIFRHARFAGHSSAAPLRLKLQPAAGKLQVDIIRNRYGSLGQLTLQP